MRACDVTMFWSTTGGGVRRYIEKKREWLARTRPDIGHMAIVPGRTASLTGAPLMPMAAVRGVRIPFAPGYRTPLAGRQVIRALDAWEPDFVECGSPFLMRRAVSEWRRRSGLPVFDYYHAYFPLNYTAVLRGRLPALCCQLERLGWRYLRHAYSDSERIFVASACVRRRLASEGIVNTEPAPLGVDLSLFSPQGRERRSGAKTMLFVGRLSEEKGLSLVLECFRLLSGERDLRLVIVGDGIMRRNVEALASRDSWVRYAGFLDSEGLAREYRNADVLVSGAPAETLGLTFLEALASGTPVAGLSGSGLMDELPGEVASAVPNRDAELLARAAAAILDSPPDPAACRAAAEPFDWDTRLEHILEREIELSGSAGPVRIGA
ncbi:glycosyltransferase family 1 protein [Candidatus Fermentibacteria bacterium]|nr:glycosyltransferase family 1 protein [Candidatus Fermentibacteria bacterium]